MERAPRTPQQCEALRGAVTASAGARLCRGVCVALRSVPSGCAPPPAHTPAASFYHWAVIRCLLLASSCVSCF